MHFQFIVLPFIFVPEAQNDTCRLDRIFLSNLLNRTVHGLQWRRLAVIHDNRSAYILQKLEVTEILIYEINDDKTLMRTLTEMHSQLFPDVNVVVALEAIDLVAKVIHEVGQLLPDISASIRRELESHDFNDQVFDDVIIQHGLQNHPEVGVVRVERFLRQARASALLDSLSRECHCPWQFHTVLQQHGLMMHPRAGQVFNVIRARHADHQESAAMCLVDGDWCPHTDSTPQSTPTVQMGSGPESMPPDNVNTGASPDNTPNSTPSVGVIPQHQTSEQEPSLSPRASTPDPDLSNHPSPHSVSTPPLTDSPPSQSETPYRIQVISERTFATNLAQQVTFEVTFNHQWQGRSLLLLYNELLGMMNDILTHVVDMQQLDPHDLGCVIIYHSDLNNASIFPLTRWDKITAESVLDHLQKLLNSHQSMALNQSFRVVVGSIRFPRGGTGTRPNLQSIARKKSVVQIHNPDDNLCMLRALAVCLCDQYKVSQPEWEQLLSDHTARTYKQRLMLILEQKKCGPNLCRYIRVASASQKALALLLAKQAHLYAYTYRPLGLDDLPGLEVSLKCRIVVISQERANAVVYKGRSTGLPEDAPTLFLLHEAEGHFAAIVNVKAFYGSERFCMACFKPYRNAVDHMCEFACRVCGSSSCFIYRYIECPECHRTCRSPHCFERHKEKKEPTPQNPNPTSMCERYFQCPDCTKLLKVSARSPFEHVCGEWQCRCCKAYVVGEHFCYNRIPTPRKKAISKLAFFDFETRQDSRAECDQGYKPVQGKCKTCKQTNCSHWRKCQHCLQTTCGHYQHIANFVVCHTVCDLCEKEPMHPDAVCTHCGSRCKHCNARDSRTHEFKHPPCPESCGRREVFFQEDTPSSENPKDAGFKFSQWLFDESHRDFTVLAHNGKAFDHWFLLHYLITHGQTPDVCFAGTKIMSLHVKQGYNIRVLDSLNFVNLPLAALPETFNLTELSKGYFPHYFNTLANQHYEGCIPDAHYYGPDTMMEETRTAFLKWHKQQVAMQVVFNFRQEMLKYCRSDVMVLSQACLRFRHMMRQVTCDPGTDLKDTGIDPFQSTTIASVCMDIFKRKYLKETWHVWLGDACNAMDTSETSLPEGVLPMDVLPDMPHDDDDDDADEDPVSVTTALDSSDPPGDVFVATKQGSYMWVSMSGENVPVEDLPVVKQEFQSSVMPQVPRQGYGNHVAYSKASILWLKYIEDCGDEETGEPIHLQHALNGGEYKIPGTRYFVDGYDAKRRHCYEFHGCHLHGCKTCFPKRRHTLKLPRTRQTASELYALRKKKKAVLESLGYTYTELWYHEYEQMLKYHDPFKTFVESCDIPPTRLYPRDAFFGGRTSTIKLFYKARPGEKILYLDFCSLYPYCNKYTRYPVGPPTIITKDFKPLSEYFGLAKVKILPPRDLYHPVLPHRSGGKLTFPLCRTCCETSQLTHCHHSEAQRVLTGTWCTPELMKALEKGYTVITLYEVYHFEETTQYDPDTGQGGILGDYINTFLKLKQEASGWPSWCESEEDKALYLQRYVDHEKIVLNPDHIMKNKGLRRLSKLCLNSLWGKFGENLDRQKHSSFFHSASPSDFYSLLTDTDKQVQNFYIVSDQHMYVEWTHNPNFRPEDYKTNIFWACFTTCTARLKLYSVLDLVKERVLYMDTDSCIFVSNRVDPDPEIGDMLGQLTSEISKPGDYITTFVSAGPKNYAFETAEGDRVCKVKGFRLNFANSQLIHFDSMKALVSDQKTNPRIHIRNPCTIKRDKLKAMVYNDAENKMYRQVYTKRVILPHTCEEGVINTLPYGHDQIP